jgi:lipoyl(octanoyl) transferase
VRISRWITSHGFAFNVTTDLDFFKLIVPCGIAGGGVTSLSRETGRRVSMADAEASLIRHFAEVFDRRVVEAIEVAPRRSIDK